LNAKYDNPTNATVKNTKTVAITMECFTGW